MKAQPWTCATCQQRNELTNRFCGHCGEARADTTSPPRAHQTTDFIAPWDRPGWKDSVPEDPCTEPECSKTVRHHIEEFRAIVNGSSPVFARPARIPIEGSQEAKVREQARTLLGRK